MATYQEIDSNGNEAGFAVRHRLNGILDAQRKISTNIWSYIEKPSQLAYDHLNAAIDAGVDITDPAFIQGNRPVIRMALPVITANLQEDLVKGVVRRMLDLTRMSSARRHAVELFPKNLAQSKLERRPTLMDLAKDPPAELTDAFSMVDERARHVVVGSIVVPDELARIGLSPVDFYSSAIVGDNHIISVPTCVDGVYLRYTNITNMSLPKVEFIMEPVIDIRKKSIKPLEIPY